MEYMDVQPIHPKMSDEQAKSLIVKAAGCHTAEEFQNLDKTLRMEVLAELKKRNASYRQISIITQRTVPCAVCRVPFSAIAKKCY